MSKLRQVRLSKGLTQERLEELSGVLQVNISNIEIGRVRKPSWEIVWKLSRALEVSPEELFPPNEANQVNGTAA